MLERVHSLGRPVNRPLFAKKPSWVCIIKVGTVLESKRIREAKWVRDTESETSGPPNLVGGWFQRTKSWRLSQVLSELLTIILPSNHRLSEYGNPPTVFPTTPSPYPHLTIPSKIWPPPLHKKWSIPAHRCLSQYPTKMGKRVSLEIPIPSHPPSPPSLNIPSQPPQRAPSPPSHCRSSAGRAPGSPCRSLGRSRKGTLRLIMWDTQWIMMVDDGLWWLMMVI